MSNEQVAIEEGTGELQPSRKAAKVPLLIGVLGTREEPIQNDWTNHPKICILFFMRGHP